MARNIFVLRLTSHRARTTPHAETARIRGVKCKGGLVPLKYVNCTHAAIPPSSSAYSRHRGCQDRSHRHRNDQLLWLSVALRSHQRFPTGDNQEITPEK